MKQNFSLNVVSVNVSEKKGTIKKPVNEIEINKTGIVSDAHAGDWQRQVSLLSKESIDRFSKQEKRKIKNGEFAENITVEGHDLADVVPLDRFRCGTVDLEVTQVGKKCHGDNCAIFTEVGNCIMPKEGIFTRVVEGGSIIAGDTIKFEPKIFRILIITLSDRASKGEYEDLSGPIIKEHTEKFFKERKRLFKIDTIVIPDDETELKFILDKEKTQEMADVIFTTGGTGVGPRDITVDVVRPYIDKEIPGIMEMIRMKFGQENPKALISRSIAGIMGESQIYTLPGSVRAVEEYLGEIFKVLEHIIYMQHGIDMH